MVLNTKSPLCLDLMGLTRSRCFERTKTFRFQLFWFVPPKRLRRHQASVRAAKNAKSSIFKTGSKSAVVSLPEL
ncbi:hypothetical protein RB195_015483 [Necator americanus]|uniref:Uncharacterized protein n=1 Tax=Necator americanus TaxID=51031 RepID=A0ABR1D089_NECAM